VVSFGLSRDDRQVSPIRTLRPPELTR
jgi:hypothetical protein